MKIKYSEKMKVERNGNHQSDFYISNGSLKSRVTILATQPIRPSEDGKYFELASKQEVEQMCYSSFNCNDMKIICHDLPSGRDFERQIRSKLSGLENPEE